MKLKPGNNFAIGYLVKVVSRVAIPLPIYPVYVDDGGNYSTGRRIAKNLNQS